MFRGPESSLGTEKLTLLPVQCRQTDPREVVGTARTVQAQVFSSTKFDRFRSNRLAKLPSRPTEIVISVQTVFPCSMASSTEGIKSRPLSVSSIISRVVSVSVVWRQTCPPLRPTATISLWLGPYRIGWQVRWLVL